jgi:hypothetical protein
MNETTPRFGLTLLHPGQAQKEMSHNEAITLIDAALHSRAIAVGANTPPAAAATPGDCWVLGDTPIGAWSGHPHAVAAWTDGGWRFIDPVEGMRLWIDVDQGFARFSDGEWWVGTLHGKVFVQGEQVVGTRVDAIAEPAGGIVVDAEARAAVVAVLEALRSHGLIREV